MAAVGDDSSATLAGPAPSTEAVLDVGSRVARYVVLKRVARGGMGVIYLAYDEDLDRRVALKILAGDDGADGKARLLREAQAMAKLSHPNVVAVFDVGTVDDQVFLAMEFIDGVTLRAWCKSDRRTAREIVTAYLQAGRGLEAAHAAGILHRDFKPANVLADPSGRVRVLDFGLARFDGASTPLDADAMATTLPVETSTQEPLTRVGALLGTPGYMAPEQLRGEHVDPRTDEFAFCVSLFEALFGAKPYQGKTLSDLLASIEAGKVVLPGRPALRVPRGVRGAILRGLSPRPGDRFPSMKVLLEELERGLSTPRRQLAIGAAALGAAALAGVLVLRPAPVNACKGADDEVAAAWGPAQRDAVRATFDRSGGAAPVESFERARERLDRYAAAWARMRTDSCVATRVRGVQSDEALDLRTACLDQRKNELAATVNLLAKANAKLVDDAVTTVSALTTLDGCADVASLRSPYALPRDPAQRRATEAVRKELAEATALLHADKLEEAEGPLTTARQDAKLLGNRQLEAQALAALGKVKDTEGETDAAYSMMRQAAFESNVARDDVAEASASTELVFIAGYKMDRAAEGDLYASFAEAAIERAGPSDERRGKLLRHRAHVLYGRGEHDKSLPLYREALALYQRAFGKDSLEASFVEQDIADDLFSLGRMREAKEAYESSIAKVVAAGGPSHPRMILALSNLSIIEHAYGDAPAAVSAARRALATVRGQNSAAVEARLALANALGLEGNLLEAEKEIGPAIAERGRMYGTTSWWVGGDHFDWSQTLLRRHLDAMAAREADESIALLARSDSAADTLREARQIRAITLARLGHARDARAEGEAALAEEEKASPATSPRLLKALLAIGEAALGVRDPPRALAALERAAQIADTAEGYPEFHADIDLALARALVASRGDPTRARALAARAADAYEKLGLAEPARSARAVAAK